MNSPFDERTFERLLKGLEMTTVNYKDIKIDNEIFRYDAEYFRKEPVKLLAKIRNGKHFVINSEFNVSKLAGFEFTEYFTEKNLNSENNYIALTSKNIQNEELNLTEYITIDKQVADNSLQRSKLFKNDIVLSYTGEYRRSLVLFEDGKFQLGPNVCRLRPKNNATLSFYVSTFFNSKIGQIILDREKTLSAQPTVAMSRIRMIPIPILPLSFQQRIESQVKESHNKRSQAQSLYREAEALLLEHIGLSGFKPSEENVAVKSFSESFRSTGRLDAEFYQKKYEELRCILMKNSFDYLGNMCNTFRGDFVEEIYYTDDIVNYAYIRGADISSNIITKDKTTYLNRKFIKTTEKTTQTGDIVFALIGSVGTAALVTNEFQNNIVSNNLGIIRIKNTKILPEYLSLFLINKNIGGLLFAQQEMRTAQPKISDKDIHSFPIPLIAAEVQARIAALVQESFALRRESESLLEAAKAAVEREIDG